MAIHPPELAAPDKAAQVKAVQLSALVMFFLALSMIVLSILQLLQSFSWQVMVVTAGLVVYSGLTWVARGLAGRGKATLGAWLMLGGLYVMFPLAVFMEQGIGLGFALALITLSIILARSTLPGPQIERAITLGMIIGVVVFMIDLVNPPGRAEVPLVNAAQPFVAGGIVLVLIIVIVRQFQNFPLRSKLIIVSLTVSLVPLALLGIVYTANAQQRELDSATKALTAAAQETAASLDEFVQSNLNDIRVAAQSPELANLLNTPPDSPDYDASQARVGEILRALNRRDPIFLSSYALTNKTGDTIVDTYSPDIGTNKADRDWFLAVIANNLPYVSPVSVAPGTGRPSVYFSAPVRDNTGKVSGVLRARYDVGILQERVFYNNGLGGSNSGAILLDENGIQLANGLEADSAFTVIGDLPPDKIAVLRAERRLLDKPTEEVMLNLPEFATGLKNADTVPGFVAETHAKPATSHTTEDLVVTSRMKTTPWLVAFTRAQSEFLNPIAEQTRSILLAGLIIVVIIVGIAALAAQIIARPVVRLTAAAEKIGAGDLTVRAEVLSRDEIGTLAMTFNSMTRQLGELVTSLEDRVQSRTSQLEASAEVSRVATSILDTRQLLTDVVNLISVRFGFYYVSVFTLDEAGQAAVLRAATGQAGEVLLGRQHQLPLNTNSMVGGAIVTLQARIALDVGGEAVRFANPLLPGTRSEIALPLRVGNRAMGALDVQSEQANAFDEASANVLQAMADQIAVALLNAESFNRSEQQARTLAVLNQLSRELAQATSLEAIAQAVTPSVVRLVGAARLRLGLKSADTPTVAVREFLPNPDQLVGEVSVLPTDNTFAGWVIDVDETQYVSHLDQLTAQYADINSLAATGAQSLVALPLRVGDQKLGILNIVKDEVDGFSRAQISQLEQVAAQLATSLQSLTLAEQTRQTLAELDSANRRLVGQIWTDFTQTRGQIAAEWRGGQWLATDQSATLTALQTMSATPTQGLRLPIRVRGQTIGEFDVVAADPSQAAWDTEEAAFAQALIDQVAQMLENARLIEETERAAQREKAIADAADKIHRSTEIETVLRTAVTELNRITGRRGISVQLGFGPGLARSAPALTPPPVRAPKVTPPSTPSPSAVPSAAPEGGQ